MLQIVNRKPSTDSLKIDRAFSINGWMFPFEVLWLAVEASKHERIVELGSYLGRSTRALADNTPGWVLAVDDFQGPRDVVVAARENIYDQFLQNMGGVIDKIRVCREDFDSVKPEDHDPPFDMIFIDGGHDYKSVRRDIEKWYPYLTIDGLICGHDFHKEYRGVMKAVIEAFTYKVHTVPGTEIWYVTETD